jgi:NADPH:quinone reductase-like Zn-dependent oxidoreductase
MRLELCDLPPPARNEILVRVKAASVNPFDWKVRLGTMKFMTGRRLPRAMGSDFSGVAQSVGAGVTRVQVGDEVLGTAPFKRQGAFAEQLITEEKRVVRKPATLSFEEAATLPTVGVTAWLALVVKGQLKPGQRVFVNGALGGVGQAAVHIAKALGASVTGRVGPSALADAKAIGIDPVLDYTRDIPADLKKRFDIVLDTNGSLTPAQGEALVKRGGFVIDTNPSAQKFIRSLFSRRHKFVFGNPITEVLQKIAGLAGSGKLPLSTGRVAALDDAIALIGDLEAGRRTQGKAVIFMR